MALPLVLPAVSAATSPATGGGWQNGLIGFITTDGYFFVEVGAPDFIGLFTPYFNGSQIYTYEVVLNITSLTPSGETAIVHLVDTDSGRSIANLTVPMAGFSNQMVPVIMPTVHSWTNVRVAVDSTPGYFQWETPYTLFSLGNLFNGGIDLAMFLGFGVYLWVAYPLSVKAERMTKRAVYAPEWRAAWWLHGIVIGFLAFYATDFAAINSTFQGAEVFLIPLPEAFFAFFWSAGRHSRRIVVVFDQPITVPGRPLGFISRKFYGGIDPDGNIILVKYNSRSILQWWYRSRGHHVKVWALYEDGRPASRLSSRQSVLDAKARPSGRSFHAQPVEPLTMPIYDYESLSPDQLRDPSRLPRSGIYDQFRGAAILGEGGNEEETVSFRFVVARISDFRIVWPSLSIHRTVTDPAYVDPEGVMHDASTREVLTWPHIVDGSAQVTLMSWHGMDVYAQAFGWMEGEDLVQENDDARVALWAARAQLSVESGRKAEEATLANRDILDRSDSDLEQSELESLVDKYNESRRRRDPASGADGA